MAKRARNDTEMPKDVALSLSEIHFPAHDDPFRVQMALTDGSDLPMRLWFENKQSKAQWECLVKDIQDRKPKDANYVLPAPVVVNALQEALSALGSKHGDTNDCSLELKSSKNGHLNLLTKLRFSSSLGAEYSFDLVPIHMEKIDILEAKLRDLEDANQSADSFFGLFATTTTKTLGGSSLLWTASQSYNEEIFALESNVPSMTLAKKGMYKIQVTGIREWSGGRCLNILVNGQPLASTPVQESFYWNSASHLLNATEESTTLEISCHGNGHPLLEDATLTVVYLGRFS
ncbi:unnamed protein product [Aphanomyces euteiches]|nr:hypothetical protein Ae201684P_000295 [Aphanomyces euteiches]